MQMRNQRRVAINRRTSQQTQAPPPVRQQHHRPRHRLNQHKHCEHWQQIRSKSRRRRRSPEAGRRCLQQRRITWHRRSAGSGKSRVATSSKSLHCISFGLNKLIFNSLFTESTSTKFSKLCTRNWASRNGPLRLVQNIVQTRSDDFIQF